MKTSGQSTFISGIQAVNHPEAPVQNLLVILGDQLDGKAPALAGLDPTRDAVFMAEVRQEAEHVPSHRQRTTLFLSAMRHFALELIEKGVPLRYITLDDSDNTQSLGSELARAIKALRPNRVQVVRPGDFRVQEMLLAETDHLGLQLDIREDTSFSCSLDAFNQWADDGRKELVMEFFYRARRRALNILVDKKGKPVNGQWNFDQLNRQAFKEAPEVPKTYQARPDKITREVMNLVERTWPDAPGRMNHFQWPVTRAEARRALHDFIENRLPDFGTFEDAMWAGEPVLYHSRLASSLNLKLLHPRECVDAALDAYEKGKITDNNIEGFVRQIIGWREFIRGVYYREGSGYRDRNALNQHGALPEFYWTAKTDMNCMKNCIEEVLENAWGHHIQRLMVLGNFAMTAGIHPARINEWFLAMYVDAVDWVTSPNVIGMSQHADHGIVGTKPYAASAGYIKRMSNYCDGCRYNAKTRCGGDACPFNTFYWDFLLRHHKTFKGNPRMAIALRNADRLDDSEQKAIQTHANHLRRDFGIGEAGK